MLIVSTGDILIMRGLRYPTIILKPFLTRYFFFNV